MERLTRKTMFGDYGLEEETKQDAVNNKLGKLEDIEQELGIDLITLFKALTDGIVETYFTFNQGKPLKSFKPDFDKKCFYMLGGRDGPDLYYYFKDYGRTWALTKGELEK